MCTATLSRIAPPSSVPLRLLAPCQIVSVPDEVHAAGHLRQFLDVTDRRQEHRSDLHRRARPGSEALVGRN
ncbi:hypothetical protein FAIPA1_20163 [Frankia sp. AiPs1]